MGGGCVYYDGMVQQERKAIYEVVDFKKNVWDRVVWVVTFVEDLIVFIVLFDVVYLGMVRKISFVRAFFDGMDVQWDKLVNKHIRGMLRKLFGYRS